MILEEEECGDYFLRSIRSKLHTELNLSVVKFHELMAILKYIFAASIEEEGGNSLKLYAIMFIGYRVRHGHSYLLREISKGTNYWEDSDVWFSIIDFLKRFQGDDSHQFGVKRQGVKDWFKKSTVASERKIKTEKVIQNARDFEIIFEINTFMSRL